MFNFKKKRAEAEAQRQLALQLQEDNFNQALTNRLQIPDSADRYLAVFALKKQIDAQEENILSAVKDKKSRRCFKAGLVLSSPVPLAWLAIEPVSGSIAIFTTVIFGIAPSVFFKELLQKTSYADHLLKEVQPYIDQLKNFSLRTDKALEKIETEEIEALAASHRISELSAESPRLEKRMAAAFRQAAKKSAETRKNPPKPDHFSYHF